MRSRRCPGPGIRPASCRPGPIVPVTGPRSPRWREEHPDVDLLVCNAGVTCQRPLLSDVTEATLREVMEVHFFGPALARAFAPALRRPGSGVIFVLSVSAVALSRSAPVSAQGFGQKALGRCCVAFSRQKEVDRRTAGVDSPVK